MSMKEDYRKSEEGIRRFKETEIYQETLKFQSKMSELGVAWHNHFADECAIDFCCCEGDNMKELKGDGGNIYPATNYKYWIPSHRSVVKLALEELFEECKHGDEEHQKWLENKFKKYLNDNF